MPDVPRSVFEPHPAQALVSFARVRTEHPEVKQLQDAVEKMVAELNARALQAYARAVPVGAVAIVPQGIFPSDFRLGEEWVPCDGRTIVDADSPITGIAIPAMAGNVGGVACDFWLRIKD